MSNLLEVIEGVLHRQVERDAAVGEWQAKIAKAKDIAAAALKVQGCGSKSEVEALLAAVPLPENVNLASSFSRTWRKLIEDSTSGPITKGWGYYMVADGDFVLSRLGATHETMGAAAAMFAVTELEARRDRNLRQREVAIAEGCQLIESSWDATDVSWTAKGVVSFNFTAGRVLVGENLGQRLLSYYVANGATAKAA